jgi:peptidoglycan-associated lipoprotein
MRRIHLLVPALLCVALLAGCPPTYPKCNNDKDCHEKEYCVNGQCQQCKSDGDCPSGKCNAGRCAEAQAPVSSACTDDKQCPAGQSCIDGKCKPCVSDDQCGEGGKCNAGKCQRAAAAPPVNASCTLEPIYFDFNESVLTTEATTAIDRDAECVKKTNHDVTLTGRTDPRGTEEYNLALSDKRGQQVKSRLSAMGVSKAIKVNSRGELDATGKDEAGWAKDRRVDLAW